MCVHCIDCKSYGADRSSPFGPRLCCRNKHGEVELGACTPPRTNSVWSAFKARQMASERAGATSDYRIDGVLCCGGSSRPAHVYPTRPAQPSQCAARPPAWGMMDVGRQVTSASSTFLTRLQKGRDHTPVIKRKLAIKRRTHLSRLRVSCIVTCTRNNGRSLHRIINKQTP